MSHSHSNHQTVLLSEHPHGAICKCNACNMYTIAYKTMVIPLSLEGFLAFEKMLGCFRSTDFNMEHPQGMKAVMRNNQSDLSIALTVEEVENLLSMYREAHLMEEIFNILRD